MRSWRWECGDGLQVDLRALLPISPHTAADTPNKLEPRDLARSLAMMAWVAAERISSGAGRRGTEPQFVKHPAAGLRGTRCIPASTESAGRVS